MLCLALLFTIGRGTSPSDSNPSGTYRMGSPISIASPAHAASVSGNPTLPPTIGTHQLTSPSGVQTTKPEKPVTEPISHEEVVTFLGTTELSSPAQAKPETPAPTPLVQKPAETAPATPAQKPDVQEKPRQVAQVTKPMPPKPTVRIVESNHLPMARYGEIPNPSVLAVRIRESLAADASGNGLVRGANITPNGFLRAIQKAGGTVTGVTALPTYLENLKEGAMPSGKITMSRVLYTRDSNGKEDYVLDISTGAPRTGHQGERGWYDANTGLLILAGDCSNSPLSPIVNYVPPPAPVAQQPVLPPQQVTSSCPKGKTLELRVFSSEALKYPGVKEAIERTRGSTDFMDASRVSREYGEKLYYGKYPRANRSYRSVVNVIKRDGSVIPYWNGLLTPKTLLLPVPPQATHGDLIQWIIDPLDRGGLESPIVNKEGEAAITASYAEFVKCNTLFAAIRKPK